MRNKFLLIVLALVTTGCASTAGPFVTNISSDGRGGVTVEKCMLRYDRMLAVVENSNCASTSVTLTK